MRCQMFRIKWSLRSYQTLSNMTRHIWAMIKIQSGLLHFVSSVIKQKQSSFHNHARLLYNIPGRWRQYFSFFYFPFLGSQVHDEERDQVRPFLRVVLLSHRAAVRQQELRQRQDESDEAAEEHRVVSLPDSGNYDIYTEHQKKLISSLERCSLSSTASK